MSSEQHRAPSGIEGTGTPGVKRAAFAATIGNMLEFYDFITYSFFAIEIGHTFFPAHSEYGSLMLSLATFGAGFATRPIGGIVLGIYSDRFGRRPAMLLSFALMGVAILVLSLTPSYNAIGVAAPIIVIVARMAQGFALGGEVGPTDGLPSGNRTAATAGAGGFVATGEPADRRDHRCAGRRHPQQDDGSRGARSLWLASRIPDRGPLSALRPLDAPDFSGDDLAG